MNPFLLPPEERQSAWKSCRQGLRALSENEQLLAVTAFWVQAPLSAHAYDVTDPASWPSPWEMLHAGLWCARSRAIGMEFTLRLSGWDPARLKLVLAHDHAVSDTVMVVEIDNEKLLNYDLGKIITLPERPWNVIGSWRFSGKFYESVPS